MNFKHTTIHFFVLAYTGFSNTKTIESKGT